MSAASISPTQDSGTEQHGLRRHSDGGWGLVPVQTRSERFRSTDLADFPKVTGREAVWKFTPIARFPDLFGDGLDGSAYEFDARLAAGMTAGWVDRDDQRIGTVGAPEERASAAGWSGFEKALLIRVTGEEAGEGTVIRSQLGTAPRAAHTIVEAAPFSRAVVILQNDGDARLTENVEILVGEGADLTVISLQQWSDESVHLASHFATVGRDARLKHIVVTLGGGIVRLNPSISLDGRGADVEALGLYFADAGQHFEQQVYVAHVAPNTRSRVTYKGALQGDGARTVWIGDVLIGRNASGTDSYEQNRNLVLTEGTRADSIPNLEIETGDILGAGHASATGRFDDEQLFYLQARGITEDEARRLVVRGFLAEIVQKIGSSSLQERLLESIEAELAAGRDA